jgi:formate/nitrite transporter FocA (FNT family)
MKQIKEKKEKNKVKRPYEKILNKKIEEGLAELCRPAKGLFFSALSAGLDVGFSLLIMGVVVSLTQGIFPENIVKLLYSLAYPVGFIFVILGRSELFTEHTTLAVVPVLKGKASFKLLARLWGIIFSANIIGAGIFALILSVIGPQMDIISADILVHFAEEMTADNWWTILASATMAGWMMGLLAWLVTGADDTLSKIVIVALITFGIGIAGFHHSIVGSVEVLSGLFVSPEITIFDYLKFIIWSTLGNAIGGTFFVAILKYSHAIRPGMLPERVNLEFDEEDN